MFLASEAITRVTAPEFLVPLFKAVAFIVAVVWVKAALYRRRMKDTGPLQKQRGPYPGSAQRSHPCATAEAIGQR